MKHSDLVAAYFTMEAGFYSDLKTYSGGLGILAGDDVMVAVTVVAARRLTASPRNCYAMHAAGILLLLRLVT